MVASVGPVMTAALESHGVTPRIIPKHPKMASLMKAAGDAFANAGQDQQA